MSDWTHTLILALIQGLSEFLPVSSSAHLVLPSQLLGWPDQGLMFDVAVHMGTLVAVATYFRRDLLALLGDLYPPARARFGGVPGELGRLILASLPAVTAGVLLSHFIELYLRSIAVIAFTTVVFGLLLGVASRRDHTGTPSRGAAEPLEQVSWRDALIIGCAQALSLVPGTSRSGVTITAGLLLGYSAHTSARFSFLLSVPIILGAMLFLSVDAVTEGPGPMPLVHILSATVVAGLSAYATIALFLKALARVGMMPFVWYRLALGAVLTAVIFV